MEARSCLRTIIEAAIAAGARLAEPGEFTLRAYLNGRLDLMQAEAVADLIDAVTPLQARAAFDQLQGTLTREIGDIDAALFDLIARLEASVDFPEEGYHFVDPGALAQSIDAIVLRMAMLLAHARRGRLVREGLQIAIIGRPNVGKSSLFNALVGTSRAIVTEVPGTTRDLVTEIVDLDGLRVTLVDTAGIRETEDIVESEGVARTRQAADVSDLILLVADGSRPPETEDLDMISQRVDNKCLIVVNKSDLPAAWSREDAISVSAKTGLRNRVVTAENRRSTRHRPGRRSSRDHERQAHRTRAARPRGVGPRPRRRAGGGTFAVGGICVGRSSRGACGARRGHRETIFGRCAHAHLREVLYWKVRFTSAAGVAETAKNSEGLSGRISSTARRGRLSSYEEFIRRDRRRRRSRRM